MTTPFCTIWKAHYALRNQLESQARITDFLAYIYNKDIFKMRGSSQAITQAATADFNTLERVRDRLLEWAGWAEALLSEGGELKDMPRAVTSLTRSDMNVKADALLSVLKHFTEIPKKVPF